MKIGGIQESVQAVEAIVDKFVQFVSWRWKKLLLSNWRVQMGWNQTTNFFCECVWHEKSSEFKANWATVQYANAFSFGDLKRLASPVAIVQNAFLWAHHPVNWACFRLRFVWLKANVQRSCGRLTSGSSQNRDFCTLRFAANSAFYFKDMDLRFVSEQHQPLL